MSDDTRRPIADVLPGFTIHALDEGWTPLQAFVLIKSLDDSGDTSWSYRISEQLNLEELLGALTVQVELIRRSLISEWDTNESE